MSITPKKQEPVFMEVRVFDPLIFNEYKPDDEVFLISWFDKTGKTDQSNFTIQSKPPRKNNGHLLNHNHGWLGCTDSLSRSALGRYRIQSMEVVTRNNRDGTTEEIGVDLELVYLEETEK